jgi:hypothetical protein
MHGSSREQRGESEDTMHMDDADKNTYYQQQQQQQQQQPEHSMMFETSAVAAGTKPAALTEHFLEKAGIHSSANDR